MNERMRMMCSALLYWERLIAGHVEGASLAHHYCPPAENCNDYFGHLNGKSGIFFCGEKRRLLGSTVPWFLPRQAMMVLSKLHGSTDRRLPSSTRGQRLPKTKSVEDLMLRKRFSEYRRKCCLSECTEKWLSLNISK